MIDEPSLLCGGREEGEIHDLRREKERDYDTRRYGVVGVHMAEAAEEPAAEEASMEESFLEDSILSPPRGPPPLPPNAPMTDSPATIPESPATAAQFSPQDPPSHPHRQGSMQYYQRTGHEDLSTLWLSANTFFPCVSVRVDGLPR